MRELIGYLVAGRGHRAGAAARMAVGIHHRFLCETFLCKEYPAHSADCPFPDIAADSTRIPNESHPTDSAKTGTPITNIYAAETSSRHVIEAIARARPRIGVLDRGLPSSVRPLAGERGEGNVVFDNPARRP